MFGEHVQAEMSGLRIPSWL